jgi:hypothetical protein
LPNFLERLGPGVLEYWSVEKEDVNPLAITPTLHKDVEQSRVMESRLPGGKPKPGPLGLDSLLTQPLPYVIIG